MAERRAGERRSNTDRRGGFVNGTYLNGLKPKRRDSKKLKYLRISAGPLRGEYVHRLIAAAVLGRPLTPDETVDHKDGNTLNDWYENLEVVSWQEHGRRTRERERLAKLAAEAQQKLDVQAESDVPF